MKKLSTVRRNVLLFYLLGALAGWGGMMGPVIYMFFTKVCLMSMFTVFVLQAYYAGLLSILEWKTGNMADQLGRKRCILIGCWLQAVACLIFGFATSLELCVLAETIFAIADAFESGADKALLSSTLAGRRRILFKRIVGRAGAMSAWCMIGASLVGGHFGAEDPRFPFMVLTAIFASRAVLAHFFVETLSVSHDDSRSVSRVVAYCFVQNKHAGWTIFVMGTQFGLLILAFWTYVPYFERVGLDKYYFGLVFAYLNTISGFSSLWVEQISNTLGEKWSHRLLWISCVLGFSVPMLVPGIAGIAVFGLFLSFVRGFGQAYLADELDRETPDEYKATVFSMASMVGRLLYVIFLVMIGQYLAPASVFAIWNVFFVIALVSALKLGGIKRILLSPGKVR